MAGLDPCDEGCDGGAGRASRAKPAGHLVLAVGSSKHLPPGWLPWHRPGVVLCCRLPPATRDYREACEFVSGCGLSWSRAQTVAQLHYMDYCMPAGCANAVSTTLEERDASGERRWPKALDCPPGLFPCSARKNALRSAPTVSAVLGKSFAVCTALLSSSSPTTTTHWSATGSSGAHLQTFSQPSCAPRTPHPSSTVARPMP